MIDANGVYSMLFHVTAVVQMCVCIKYVAVGGAQRWQMIGRTDGNTYRSCWNAAGHLQRLILSQAVK